MTENIFNAGELIDALINKSLKELSTCTYRRTEDNFDIMQAELIILKYTRQIIDIVKYEQETVRYGKCCHTCATEPECKECLEKETVDGVEINRCDRPDFLNWQPQINKATLGLEEQDGE